MAAIKSFFRFLSAAYGLFRRMFLLHIYADEDCVECAGEGVVEINDIVDYGSITISMPSRDLCDCILMQIPDHEGKFIVHGNSDSWENEI